MASSNNPTIVVIDPQRLRQASLVCLLEDWADFDTFEIAAASSCEELRLERNLAVVVINIGALSVLERPPRIWLQSVRSFVPSTPLVILSDREERSEICAAFAEGARGFIPTSIEPSIALDALKFIHRGGSFFPSSALIEEARRTHEINSDSTSAELDVARHGHITDVDPPVERTHMYRRSISLRSVARSSSQYAGFGMLTDSGPDDNLRAPEEGVRLDAEAARCDVSRELQLTPRQHEVLKGLGEGKANKVIARDLDMTESTVKVHVRQIMRKFGAKNRTQVALFAVQFGRRKPGSA